MEIQLICIGKTDDFELRKIISNYENRLKHYIKFSFLYIPDIKDAKNLSQDQQIGGPYGFDKTVLNKYTAKISLSKMTFSHQMIRLFFIEQLYRANTILRNEPYHHR